MKRRDLLKIGGMGLAAAARLPLAGQAGGLIMLPGAGPAPEQGHQPASVPGGDADYTLRIAPVTVELDATHIVSTIGYNGTAPGPVLRMKEGKPVTVDIINDTDTPELVHWHGMLIPPDVDGAAEEGSPFVPPHGRAA